MDKPITIIYEGFRQDLANLINNSGLPAFVIESVLQNYLLETRSAAERQYQSDKIKYDDCCKSNNIEE